MCYIRVFDNTIRTSLDAILHRCPREVWGGDAHSGIQAWPGQTLWHKFRNTLIKKIAKLKWREK